ncbi:hypothetical protein MSAN_02051200 [Mycena sanguinolenta]|uniref:Uncharacterized protein n=1 Tax=Mycena sanguinolenta TaxID=230812 RepID=A0A8H7CN12_9AGAR|nr:hypothetical protein MSAN_02051200 [Mycena sanguinolenta]
MLRAQAELRFRVVPRPHVYRRGVLVPPGRPPASRRGLHAIRPLEVRKIGRRGFAGRLPRRDFRRVMGAQRVCMSSFLAVRSYTGGHEMAASFRHLVVHPPCLLHIDSSDSASSHVYLFLDDSSLHVALRGPSPLDLLDPSPSQIIMVPIPSFHHTSTLDPRIARTHPGHDYLASHSIKAQLGELQVSLKRNPTPAAGFPFSASQHLALDSSRA